MIEFMDSKDFMVVRVISFTYECTKKRGTICYLRPLTVDYNGDELDDFDRKMLEWLEDQKFLNVQIAYKGKILFKDQINEIQKRYCNSRFCSKLCLYCHGDYTDDEVIERGTLHKRDINLNIYWVTTQQNCVFDLDGEVAFDKNKEEYFFGVIDSLTSL